MPGVRKKTLVARRRLRSGGCAAEVEQRTKPISRATWSRRSAWPATQTRSNLPAVEVEGVLMELALALAHVFDLLRAPAGNFEIV